MADIEKSGSAAALCVQGDLDFHAGNLDGALHCYGNAISLASNTLHAFRMRANIFIRQGNFNAARDGMQQNHPYIFVSAASI